MSSLVWITGLSGSGKTTIGKKVYEALKVEQENTVFLDGDDFREIFGNDLGHDRKDRIANARRISRMCKFLISQNINVVCATMSLYKEIHELNRREVENYIEIFIKCDMQELIRRDKKSLYSKAINKEIDNIVGINAKYDEPELCELTIDNSKQDELDNKVKKILDYIRKEV